jgi:hypothetical protein
MGLFDTVVFEGDLPEGLKPSDSGFETKSLFRMMSRFTVTKEGQLIHHAVRYVVDASCPGGFNTLAPVENRDIDMHFHGDIVLTSFEGDSYTDHVLRFTHGTLEWVRPIEALSVEEQNIALARSLDG